ncbi:Methyltransferase domain-containing protein [Cognatiyoonia koreensis]|uniref:Methyltransferase domain-containing protein n=1 Tax=Cognatiyoonia koreensis TaxID=364200 RepID=A0A1I0N4V6_9RHOB|nr:methyltransferase domain-containing protein [Cognatiyoonia koreensis]SEV96106.1 Methyltransferase domain-containing protein [Cognatiyoonia koreensis]
MDYAEKISTHYGHGHLLAAIRAGLEAQGIAPEKASIADLGPVDEFHIGGRVASAHFLDQLEITPSQLVLDVGCGLGGAARFGAKTYGAQLVGIDLTPEYVTTGQALCAWVGLADQVTLHEGSALALPFAAAEFDSAYMMHVGMNIQDKMALFAEVSRVLKPGARFGVYDIMKTNDEDLLYPVPWATTAETSWPAAPENYREAFENNGFTVVKENNRRTFALEFFRKMKAAADAGKGPPPLGLHVLMQQSSAEKVPNMVANLTANRISPVEMIGVKNA